jgi:hypothetical protein
MDLDIDLVMSSCKGKKTFVITLLRDKESWQRDQCPYLAQRLELGTDLPLLDVVEEELQVALGRRPCQGRPSPYQGVWPGADKVTAGPYVRGLDDRFVTEHRPAEYPPRWP